MGMTPTPPTQPRASLMGPVILITIGLMFLLAQFVPGWGFGKTWPALLIVIGVIKLLDVGRPPRPPEGPRI
jgi:cell wall-active antibiotic response 4TMS protein YvqF